MINNALAKYADIKRGLFDTHYEISGKPPTSNNSTEEPKQAISLIDLEDNTNSSQTPANNNNANVLDELSDIFGSSAAISSPAAQSVQNDIFGSGAITSPTVTATTTKSIASGNSSSDLFDLLGQTNSNSAIASPSVHHANVPQATPSNALEQNSTTVTLVNKNGLHIELEINQVDTKYYVKAYFSNVSTAPMEKLMLKLAAPKVHDVEYPIQRMYIITV